MNDIISYKWGWISTVGKRHPKSDPIPMDSIAGIWGEIYRDGKPEPFCRETFLKELPNKENAPGARLQTINLRQCVASAYPGENIIGDYAIPYVIPEPDKTMLFQSWKCPCGHTFDTDMGIKRKIKQILKGELRFIPCEACHEKTAKRAGTVRKDIA